MMAHVAHGLLILVIVLAALVGPAQAAPRLLAAPANGIIVTSLLDTADPGKCRLRDAITAANMNVIVGDCTAGALGLDSITFLLSPVCRFIQCILKLAGPLPSVSEALTINGGPYGVEISGENLYPVFDLSSVVVNLSNLVIANGQVDPAGGGIHMAGTTLTVKNVYFSGNQAKFNGGAINESSGTLTIYNSVFSGNHSLLGGAIAQIGGSATISESTFTANTGNTGGAVGLVGVSALHVTASVFNGNSAVVWGGAIYLQDATVQATIASSTFTNNQTLSPTSIYGGGALWLTDGALTVTASTLANNVSGNLGGALGNYGGRLTLTNVNPATVNVNNATITGNTSDNDSDDTGDGGGISALDGTINVQNSIIAGNFDTPGNSGAGTIHPDCSLTVTSATYSLVGTHDGCVGVANGSNGNQVGAGSPLDPLLAPLADNGGPTLTQAFLSGSPAINAGNPLVPGTGGLACAAADQRGVARPLGTQCDLGAYEAGMRLFLSLLRR